MPGKRRPLPAWGAGGKPPRRLPVALCDSSHRHRQTRHLLRLWTPGTPRWPSTRGATYPLRS